MTVLVHKFPVTRKEDEGRVPSHVLKRKNKLKGSSPYCRENLCYIGEGPWQEEHMELNNAYLKGKISTEDP